MERLHNSGGESNLYKIVPAKRQNSSISEKFISVDHRLNKLRNRPIFQSLPVDRKNALTLVVGSFSWGIPALFWMLKIREN